MLQTRRHFCHAIWLPAKEKTTALFKPIRIPKGVTQASTASTSAPAAARTDKGEEQKQSGDTEAAKPITFRQCRSVFVDKDGLIYVGDDTLRVQVFAFEA